MPSLSVGSNSVTFWTVVRQGPCPVHVIFLGKDTGVGCHFLLQGIFGTQGLNLRLLDLLHCRWIHQESPNSLQPHGQYSPWTFPGQNTGVGSLSLLQRIYPTQGLYPGLPHCRWILYQLSHKGSPNQLYSKKQKQKPREMENIMILLFSGSEQ